MFGDDLKPYLPKHIQPFADQLKQFPERYEKWVHATSLPREVYQGDVVEVAPLVTVDREGGINRLDHPAMVISCSCDVQPGQGDFALLAPVLDLEDYKKNSTLAGTELENHIRALMENKISDLFFLPAGLELRASFVDFGNISSVSIDYLESERGKRRLTSLSQVGHYFFLVKLTYHFTRPETLDALRA